MSQNLTYLVLFKNLSVKVIHFSLDVTHLLFKTTGHNLHPKVKQHTCTFQGHRTYSSIPHNLPFKDTKFTLQLWYNLPFKVTQITLPGQTIYVSRSPNYHSRSFNLPFSKVTQFTIHSHTTYPSRPHNKSLKVTCLPSTATEVMQLNYSRSHILPLRIISYPPKSKKLSCMSTSLICRTAFQMWATSFSIAVDGWASISTSFSHWSLSNGGSAFLSNFPVVSTMGRLVMDQYKRYNGILLDTYCQWGFTNTQYI